MEERTVPKDSPPPLDDDAISITSTQSDAYSSEEEFLVERVLAEKKDKNNRPLYLILWAGYPEEKSTWEPKKNIQDPGILEVWAERKSQEALGAQPAFDLASFDARIIEIQRVRAERHQRRNAKRRRLGIPVASPGESELEEAGGKQAEVEANIPENEPVEPVVRRKAVRPPRSQNEAPRRAEPELPNIEPHHRAQWDLEQDDDSGSSDLDRDFLVGNKKKAQQKALNAIRQKRSGLKVSTGEVTKVSSIVLTLIKH